jgi:hypothetical protein
VRTVQVAILGGNDEAVFAGLRNFPAHKLVLLSPTTSLDRSGVISGKLAETLKLPVRVVEVKSSSIQTMLDLIGQVIHDDQDVAQDFLINLGSAARESACSGLAAAFLYGIRAFDVAGDQPEMFPVMKFNYIRAVTEPKIEILRAIERSGGQVESLEALSGIVNYGKPLLSYHIRGSQDSRGLESLGLVELERGKRGRLRVILTPLGRTLLSTEPRN